MNIPILQKCVDELAKSEPDLSYVRGMLETIIAMNPQGGKPVVGNGLPTLKGTGLLGSDPNIHLANAEEQTELSDAEQAAAEAIAIAGGGKPPVKAAVLETNIVLNERGQ